MIVLKKRMKRMIKLKKDITEDIEILNLLLKKKKKKVITKVKQKKIMKIKLFLIIGDIEEKNEYINS